MVAHEVIYRLVLGFEEAIQRAIEHLRRLEGDRPGAPIAELVRRARVRALGGAS